MDEINAACKADKPHGLRAQRSRDRLLAEAQKLVHERGYAGCTIEAIVERTGIAKTTVYRHWPSRTALLIDAVKASIMKIEVADTGALRDDLVRFFTSRSQEMEVKKANKGVWSLAGVVDAAKREPALLPIASELNSGLMNAVRTMLERGRARGEIAPKCNLDVLVNLVVGAMSVQIALLDQVPSGTDVEEVVDTILYGCSDSPR